MVFVLLNFMSNIGVNELAIFFEITYSIAVIMMRYIAVWG